MRALLMLLVCASLYYPSVDALLCNKCSFDTSLNTSTCNYTTENCSGKNKFCGTISLERHDGTIAFNRECVPSEVCKPDYCKNIIQDGIYESCNVKQCCQEDLCNGDTTVKSDHVSQFYWSLGYPYLTAVALTLLL